MIPTAPHSRWRRLPSWAWALIAALVIGAVAALVMLVVLPRGKGKPTAAPAAIAFIDEDGNLAAVLPDGSGLQVFTQDSELAVYDYPRWSPDHRWLAALRKSSADGLWALFLSSADGQESRRIPLTALPACLPAFWCLDWSPDGQQVAFPGTDPSSGFSRLAVVDVTKQSATMASPTGLPTWETLVTAAWLPGGDLLAVTATNSESGSAMIYTLRPDGSDLVPMTLETGGADSAGFPVFSRAGDLGYITYDQATDAVRVYVARADGGQPQLVTDTPAFPVDWSVDGGYLLLFGEGVPAFQIYTAGAMQPTRLDAAARCSSAAALSADGQRLACASQDGELLVVDLAQGTARVLEDGIGGYVDW